MGSGEVKHYGVRRIKCTSTCPINKDNQKVIKFKSSNIHVYKKMSLRIPVFKSMLFI